jgi:signal transduction histidine kinase
MKTKPAQQFRLLSAAIAAMIVGLVGLVTFVHLASRRLDTMERQIVEDTAPSLVALEATSAHLSRLQSLLRQRLRHPGDLAATDTQIAAEREALAAGLATYLALPVDPGEAEIHVDIQRRVAAFDQVVDQVMKVPPGSLADAPEDPRDVLDGSASELDASLVNAANLNAEVGVEASKVLRQVKRTLLPGAIAFETASVLAAVVAIGAAYQMSRRAEEADRVNRHLLEEKAAELDAFSGRVAHDLLSPLMTVSMAVGLAEQRLSSPEDTRLHTMLARAGSSLQRVRRMVSDLLDFARAGAAPPPGVKTEVAPLLQDLVQDLESLASEAGVALELESSSPRSVRCAAGILSSVLSNLVQNAMSHGGAEPDRRVKVRAVDTEAEVRFEVEDTGPGIRPEDQELVFEPYVRRSTRGSGLGLGLATVKRLAESHGGHVGVVSEVGHGALFWVTLPVAA